LSSSFALCPSSFVLCPSSFVLCPYTPSGGGTFRRSHEWQRSAVELTRPLKSVTGWPGGGAVGEGRTYPQALAAGSPRLPQRYPRTTGPRSVLPQATCPRQIGRKPASLGLVKYAFASKSESSSSRSGAGVEPATSRLVVWCSFQF